MAGRNTFRWNRRQAHNTMKSTPVQTLTKRRAEAAAREFRRVAPRDTGRFAASVRVEPAKGWDGRPGWRVVAYATPQNAPIPIEFGNRGRAGVNALQRGIGSAERGR